MAARLDESLLKGELCWVEVHDADTSSTDDDGSFGVVWWESEFHFAEQVLRTRVVMCGWGRCGCGCVVHVNKLQSGFHLSEKPCHCRRSRFVVECGECGVVGECRFTFFIYLVVILDEIFRVVAGAFVGVLKCAKSGVRISVIVFATAC